MEDDDEFGDLYTDVLRPFTAVASTSWAPPTHQSSSSIDLNQTLPPKLEETVPGLNIAGDERKADLGAGARILEDKDVKLPDRASQDVNYTVESGVGGVDNKGDGKDVDLMDKDVSFDIEEGNTGIVEVVPGSDPIIPGISTGGASNRDNLESTRRNDGVSGGVGADAGEGDDWDSDSEDDLQIVLNDNHHHQGPMAGMERGDDEDEDDEDDGLIIVADGDNPIQVMEEQEWGEEAASQAAEGERKEAGEAGKANAGVAAVAPKIGYSNHGYHHPFHSQFKYVRPGAVAMPGSATVGPGGAAGQVRPLSNMGPVAGRGRGDWRPTGIKNTPMQKGFHPGFGVPGWGNNLAGRGFGGGLEFTLPSHKTIFDVDIDSFEEKPWKYSGADISDFFNFSLNEESWKDYCKQLEQLRLESTMQSKIRVYESGRAEQEYDPDLPPELAAATGIRDVPAENANLGKSDVGQSDLLKGSTRVRPPIPTGRAIQVEGGYGERLPSIDTRPPRMRDSDAVIEIVCQDDDDSSTGNDVPEDLERSDNDLPGDDLREDHVAKEDVAPIGTKYIDGLPETYNGRKRELVGRGGKFINSDRDNISEGDGSLPFPTEVAAQYRLGSRGQTPVYPSGKFGTPREERQIQGRARDRSPHFTPPRNSRDKKFLDNQKEESAESIDNKCSPPLSSPVAVGAVGESSVDPKDALHDELSLADGSPEVEKEDTNLNTITTNDSLKDENMLHSVKKQKISSQVEQTMLQEQDDGEDSKVARSSESSKARSGSSRDNQKWRDGVEEEVIQSGGSTRMGSIKRNLDENDQSSRRKDYGVRQEMERNHMGVRGREDSYPHRDWDPSSPQNLHMKTELFDRRKERDNSDGAWQRRDDPHSRRIITEDTRKRDRSDEIGSRYRSKVRESERGDKEEYLHLKKQLDNGSYRVHYDKDVSTRHREKDDNPKSRYEIVDDYHSKRRKEDEYIRRDHTDKEEFLHSNRENSSRRKRERDEFLDQRKRDDLPRIRDNLDDHHSVRHKDEVWSQKERGERQREREEWHRPKQSHEENPLKREREEGRGAVRSGRGADDKVWVGHARVKDEHKSSDKEYQFKDTVRHSEQQKRRDRTEDENLSHHRGREDVYVRGNQFSNEERKSRQERSSIRNEHAVNASDNLRVLEKMQKEPRKNKESDGGDHNTLGSSKRNRGAQSGHISEMGLKGTGERRTGEHEIPLHRHSSRKHREDASSDDEQQDLRRGRSKLERWTSHKERDFNINSKASSSSKFKEIDGNNDATGTSEASKLADESAKPVEMVDNPTPLAEENDAGNLEIKDAYTKPTEDRRLDTVEKLKKRSERFKLPMPIEKESIAIKKIESEARPSAKTETPADSEIKPERPARKRRWISN